MTWKQHLCVLIATVGLAMHLSSAKRGSGEVAGGDTTQKVHKQTHFIPDDSMHENTTSKLNTSSLVDLSHVSSKVIYTQEELIKMIYDDKGVKAKVGPGFFVGDMAFLRFTGITNCAGRWVDDSVKDKESGKIIQPVMMTGGASSDPDTFKCEDALPEADVVRGLPECEVAASDPAGWTTDACSAAMTVKKDAGEVEGDVARLVDCCEEPPNGNWKLDDKALGDSHGDCKDKLHHYLNVVPYVMLVPTEKTLKEGPGIQKKLRANQDEEINQKWTWGLCKGKDETECKITQGRVLLSGALRDNEVAVHDLNEDVFKAKYLTCSPENVKILETLDLQLAGGPASEDEGEKNNAGTQRGLVLSFLLAASLLL